MIIKTLFIQHYMHTHNDTTMMKGYGLFCMNKNGTKMMHCDANMTQIMMLPIVSGFVP